MRTTTGLLLGAVLVAGAGAVTAVPAHAAACSEGAGVTVVVDFASLGGGVQTGCAAGDPASGVAALQNAGHEPMRAGSQAGYFVCRIDGKPASDPCHRGSPADAYWSYWTGQPGGSWTYSDTGPADRDPAPGSVEGWAFGAGKPPSSPPPRAAAPPPEPQPEPEQEPTEAAQPAAQPAPQRSTRAAAAPTAGTAATSGAPVSSPGAVALGATPSASAQPTPTGSAAASPSASPEPSETQVVTAADQVEDGGSLAGPLLAGGVVLLLAAAGSHQVLQRRRRDSEV